MSSSRLETLKEYLEEDPTDPFLQFALAIEFVKVGHTPDAIESFESLVRDHPDYAGTYYHLARLYASSGRYKDARSTIKAGVLVADRLGETRTGSELRQLLDNLDVD
jgi:predicted Zn-dependent protease